MDLHQLLKYRFTGANVVYEIPTGNNLANSPWPTSPLKFEFSNSPYTPLSSQLECDNLSALSNTPDNQSSTETISAQPISLLEADSSFRQAGILLRENIQVRSDLLYATSRHNMQHALREIETVLMAPDTDDATASTKHEFEETKPTQLMRQQSRAWSHELRQLSPGVVRHQYATGGYPTASYEFRPEKRQRGLREDPQIIVKQLLTKCAEALSEDRTEEFLKLVPTARSLAMAGDHEEGKPPAPASERVAAAVEAVAAAGEYRNAFRRQLLALSRRIRLLGPFAEELRERRAPTPEEEERALTPLADALEKALELLRLGRARDGSRIFLAFERDSVMKKFQEVIGQLEQALCDFPYNELDISDEVREQVELVHAQLKRAKERVDMPDDEFYNDLLSLYNKNYAPSAELAILERLSEKLHLMTIADLTQESLALHEMVASGGGQDPGGRIEKMSMLLKKIKDFVQTQNPEMGPPMASKVMDSNEDARSITVPDEFRCPVSLDLMKDPVIVATGQTYERECIEKWLASGHHTCPTTQQRMTNTTLTPNYVLRSLIAQWCEANGIEPPKRSSQPNKPTSACSSSKRANIDALLSKLCSPDPEEQRSAAAELRLLAKRNANDRICIAEAGAIPLLLSLLSSSDLRTQEHAVTALLNLSIHEFNKASIMTAGAVPSIVRVLKNGSMEARENAAATLFSLSVIDEYKVTIGGTGAIPALVVLLSEGSQRGKKDAAAALFNLCIYQGNKGRAVRAGLVPLIMGLVTNPTGALMDEAVAILSILSSHQEGKAAIGAAEPVPVLVEMIGSGTPRNRENAAAAMLHLCSGEQQLVHLARAQECGIMVPLRELALNGTERGKRKAVQLLERMSRFLVQQQEQQESQLQA